MSTDAECIHGLEHGCTICLRGPTIHEPVRVSFTFTAKFEGQCRACNLPIYVGERVARLTNEALVHEACTDA